jgi:hypothetical protein
VLVTTIDRIPSSPEHARSGSAFPAERFPDDLFRFRRALSPGVCQAPARTATPLESIVHGGHAVFERAITCQSPQTLSMTRFAPFAGVINYPSPTMNPKAVGAGPCRRRCCSNTTSKFVWQSASGLSPDTRSCNWDSMSSPASPSKLSMRARPAVPRWFGNR